MRGGFVPSGFHEKISVFPWFSRHAETELIQVTRLRPLGDNSFVRISSFNLRPGEARALGDLLLEVAGTEDDTGETTESEATS